MKNSIILFITVVQLYSCGGNAFLELDQITDDHKIFVTPIPLMIRHFGGDEELKIPQGFVIENQETIKNITGDWGRIQTDERDFPLYKVFLTKNGEIERSLSINKELTLLLTGHGSYDFKPEQLFEHQNSFRYLNWISIKTTNLSHAKRLLSELEKRDFIYPSFTIPRSDFRDFQGNMIVNRKNTPNNDNYQTIIQQDFGIDSVLIKETKQIGKDSVSINFWTQAEFEESIPNNYILLNEWEEFHDLEFKVFGCDQEILEELIIELGFEAEIKTAPNIA